MISDDDVNVDDAIDEAIFWLEKALDGYKAPEEIENFARKALDELKTVRKMPWCGSQLVLKTRMGS